jgi:hypothetical protein
MARSIGDYVTIVNFWNSAGGFEQEDSDVVKVIALVEDTIVVRDDAGEEFGFRRGEFESDMDEFGFIAPFTKPV